MLTRLKKMLGFGTACHKADQVTVDLSVANRKNEEAAKRLMETIRNTSPGEAMDEVFVELLGPRK